MTCTPDLAPSFGGVRFLRRRTNEALPLFERADHRDREGAGGGGLSPEAPPAVAHTMFGTSHMLPADAGFGPKANVNAFEQLRSPGH